MRETGSTHNDLFDRLAADERIPLSSEQLAGLVTDPIELTGAARDQVATLVETVETIVADHPEAARYLPGKVL
jgi:adenylosuccinate lyase